MNKQSPHYIFFVFFSVCVMAFVSNARAEVVLSSKQFIAQSFHDSPKQEVLWLNKALKAQIAKEIDYDFHQLRVRYWGENQRTAWILEEVGKEQPITMGVVVEGSKIVGLEVLEYRESRGDEIKHEFYRKQFSGAQLKPHRKGLRLSQNIDGITGATLSVRASKKVATLALFLHQQSPYSSDVQPEKEKSQ